MEKNEQEDVSRPTAKETIAAFDTIRRGFHLIENVRTMISFIR